MNNRILFGILCICFNHLGVPCFLQGNTSKGIKRIVFGIITCNIISLINAIKGIILGINVLKMTDEEFEEKKYTLDSGIPA